jgi:RNA recognition motif-containing protein
MCNIQEYIYPTLDNASELKTFLVHCLNFRREFHMSQKIYVGNLSSNVANEMLAERFARFGVVYSAKVITDRETHRSMGFAFVEMASPEDAEKAIMNLNGSVIDGRLINVIEAKKPHLH